MKCEIITIIFAQLKKVSLCDSPFRLFNCYWSEASTRSALFHTCHTQLLYSLQSLNQSELWVSATQTSNFLIFHFFYFRSLLYTSDSSYDVLPVLSLRPVYKIYTGHIYSIFWRLTVWNLLLSVYRMSSMSFDIISKQYRLPSILSRYPFPCSSLCYYYKKWVLYCQAISICIQCFLFSHYFFQKILII